MNIITLQDVSIHFGGLSVLSGINLQIKNRERVCLVGRNGEGKSTLLKILAGDIVPDEGKILKKPIVTVSVPDTANLGNTLLCGLALGIYPSLEEAAARMVTTDKRVFHEAGAEIYEQQYSIFLELYDQLKGTFRRSVA